jgi:hypothetical protein
MYIGPWQELRLAREEFAAREGKAPNDVSPAVGKNEARVREPRRRNLFLPITKKAVQYTDAVTFCPQPPREQQILLLQTLRDVLGGNESEASRVARALEPLLSSFANFSSPPMSSRSGVTSTPSEPLTGRRCLYPHPSEYSCLSSSMAKGRNLASASSSSSTSSYDAQRAVSMLRMSRRHRQKIDCAAAAAYRPPMPQRNPAKSIREIKVARLQQQKREMLAGRQIEPNTGCTEDAVIPTQDSVDELMDWVSGLNTTDLSVHFTLPHGGNDEKLRAACC